MSAQNLTLAALNENSRFAQTNKFTALAQLVDAYSKFGTTSAPTRQEYEALLDKEISNRTLQDRIIYHLNKLGVDVSFIENDEKINGKYST